MLPATYGATPTRRLPQSGAVRARTARAVLMLVLIALALPASGMAEQASEPAAPVAGQLDAGGQHTCALDAGAVHCWGLGFTGQLGYGNTSSIGDNETPGAAGRVDLGAGRFATAISAGDFHTCALLDDGTVRCWGFGGDGRLGYANKLNIGDDESVASVGPVNIGTGRTAVAISAGGAHTCVILNTGDVLCWGFGEDGRLGYGETDQEGDEATIGDDEEPGSVAPVQIGDGRTATAITTGKEHTCVLLDDAKVRCWGSNGTLFGGDGRLGYGTADRIGDNETPATVDPLVLGGDAIAISAGDFHTCAVLAGGAVRCWGLGVDGRLGYGNQFRIGDNETPASVEPVQLGGPAAAITAGNHTCARLVSGALRCWGPGALGRLGYANTTNIGDDESPAAAPVVDVGGATNAISAGATHTCARLTDASLRCWGEGHFGRLGYANENNVGDDETPASAGPVDLRPPPIVVVEPPAPDAPTVPTVPTVPGVPSVPAAALQPPVGVAADPLEDALRAQAARVSQLRACRASALRKMRTARTSARRRYRQPRVRARALRLIAKTAARRRVQCVTRFGRTPARVTTLVARRSGRTAAVLRFDAAGSDRSRPPAARGYVIKQSRRPIRTARDFDRAPALCGGTCRFDVTAVGAEIELMVSALRRRTTYHYAIAARDNVSGRRGPRSKAVSIRIG